MAAPVLMVVAAGPESGAPEAPARRVANMTAKPAPEVGPMRSGDARGFLRRV
jgi:hypothetical protein